MKKNRDTKSGFFTPRIFLVLILCTSGLLLALFGVGAPTAPAVTTVQPVVIRSSFNGVSPPLRDLPRVISAERGEVEQELRRVKPDHAVPAGFVDPAVQTGVGAAAAPAPNLTFEGMNQAEGCGGCIPPDTNGAIGLTQYGQMVNSAFSIYSKTGTRLAGPTPINALWTDLLGACKDNNNGDPVVIYDQLADRWVLSQFAVPGGEVGYHECIAVSQTPDATGAYYVYDFPLSTTKFEDYPHFGLWPDAYYMSTHEFNAAGTAYLGAGAWAFERGKMLVGQPAQLVYFSLGNGNTALGGQLPATLDGYTLPPTGAPNYFAEVDDAADIGPADAMRIWKFHVDWSNPASSTFGNNTQPDSIIPVAEFTRPSCSVAGNRAYVVGCVPQAGDPSQLDPIGDRLMYRLAYRNFGDHESLVAVHTVVADSTTMQMGPRWYEVRDPGGSPTIFQQSTYGPTGETDLLYRFVSSVAMDHAGDLAIGYSTSSSVDFPSIAYAGRLASDPINTLAQGETQMWAGTGPQRGELFAPQTGRWGDYSALTVDPADDCTFWYTTEYFEATDAPTGAWHTRVGSFTFPQCTPITRPPGTPVLRPAGSNVVGESCTPPFNGVVDPGETVSVDLCVSNLGSANATNLVGTLAATGGVTSPGAPQTYGAVAAIGAPVCRTFTFTAANQACGSQITASLQLQEGAVNLGTVNYNFTLGSEVADFGENFDGVTAPALPAGWTTTTLPPSEPAWVTTASGPDSPPNAAYASEPATSSDKSLDSPAFSVPATGATLRFRHKFSFDAGYDGGVLEIKIGTSPVAQFQDWIEAGGTFSANGYNDVIDGTYGNPIVNPVDGTRPAWTNSSNGYITTVASFPPSASGQMVQLRFRMGSDTLAGGAGWEVDGIAVNPHFSCCSGAPLSAISQKTHGLAGTRNIDLPLAGPVGIECRAGQPVAGAHTIVVTFPNSSSISSVASATCAGNAATTSISGNQVTVNCTGVPNAQTIAINLVGVNDGVSVGDVSIPMGVLLGDVNASRRTDAGDVTAVRNQTVSIPSTSPSSFRADVNVSGRIDAGDVTATRNATVTVLP
jgi:hypothetical protein